MLPSDFHERSCTTLIAMRKDQIQACITKMQDFIQHVILEFKIIDINKEWSSLKYERICLITSVVVVRITCIWQDYMLLFHTAFGEMM